MTATLTKSFIDKISTFLSCEKIILEESDYKNFSFIKNEQKRIINVEKSDLNYSRVLDLHKNKTIVICNTVNSCTNIAIEIFNKIEQDKLKTKIICLHSRFFADDRKAKESEIKKYFGKQSIFTDVILITTQIIEVGLDISCDVMITEISPINSFLQRVGRSARWGGTANIHIFNCDKKHPYEAEISENTLSKLLEHNKQVLNFKLVNNLVDEILTDFESNIFENIKSASENTWINIIQSWQTGSKSFARELIRDIYSINIVLINENQTITNLYEYETISMHPYSLKYQLRKLMEEFEGEIPNIVFNLQPSPFCFDEEDENLELTPIQIENIEFENIVALNADYVGYSDLIGLSFDNNFGVTSRQREIKNTPYILKYHYDTFEEHIRWMLEIFEEMYSYQYPISKIQDKYYKEFDFNDLIKFMIVCHDFGKLNSDWQKIVQKYQSLKTKKEVSTILAHTDFDSQNLEDIELMKSVYREIGVNKKPPHAGIGAIFSTSLFNTIYKHYKDSKYFSSIRNIISTSILRHHSNKTITAPKYRIDRIIYYNTLSAYFDLKQNKEFDRLLTSKFDLFFDNIISFHNSIEVFVYFVFQRILRLCDQKSFEQNKRRYK